MSRQHIYIATEGHHDVAFVTRILRLYGLDLIRNVKDLDVFWKPLIPKEFPIKGDLMKRMPVPTFLQDDLRSVAVQAAGSVDKLIVDTEVSLGNLSGEVDAVAFIADADSSMDVRYRSLCEELKKSQLKLDPPLGDVDGTLRCGVWVLPNNRDSGTIENILMESGKSAYEWLINESSSFINRVQTVGATNGLKGDELAELKKPAGSSKAALAAAASVLRPGKAVQVSIQDNRWITKDTCNNNQTLKGFVEFLRKLGAID